MKTLLLDAGNSRLKWAFYEAGELSHQGALRYEWSSLAIQLDALIGRLLGEAGLLAGVTLCNVAGGEVEAILEEKLNVHWMQNTASDGAGAQTHTAPAIKKVVVQTEAYGVRSAYKTPDQLGADRWAALVAARHHCTGTSCIIDCGTAMTVDVLTADGRHAGGVIIPGMEMMRSSLLEKTHGVIASEQANISPLAVTNTEEAVQAGVQAAMGGAVQQVLHDCIAEFGEEPTCVLTGGSGLRLLSGLPETTMVEPDWVLKGLAIISDTDR